MYDVRIGCGGVTEEADEIREVNFTLNISTKVQRGKGGQKIKYFDDVICTCPPRIHGRAKKGEERGSKAIGALFPFHPLQSARKWRGGGCVSSCPSHPDEFTFTKPRPRLSLRN